MEMTSEMTLFRTYSYFSWQVCVLYQARDSFHLKNSERALLKLTYAAPLHHYLETAISKT